MKRSMIIVAALMGIAAVVVPAFAKRAAPKTVAPVAKDGIEYTAPMEREGFVVATWTKTKREIWCRQIYVIKHEYLRGLEGDVQTCFITALELKDGTLKVTNEKGSEFELALDTLDVKVLKGQAVIDHTNVKAAGK